MDATRQEAGFSRGWLGGAAKCKKSCQSLNAMLGVDDLPLEYLVAEGLQGDGLLHGLIHQEIQRRKVLQRIVERCLPLGLIEFFTESAD